MNDELNKKADYYGPPPTANDDYYGPPPTANAPYCGTVDDTYCGPPPTADDDYPDDDSLSDAH